MKMRRFPIDPTEPIEGDAVPDGEAPPRTRRRPADKRYRRPHADKTRCPDGDAGASPHGDAP